MVWCYAILEEIEYETISRREFLIKKARFPGLLIVSDSVI